MSATIFWTAAGAVGTLAAAIIAFFQFRHSKRKSKISDQLFLPEKEAHQAELAEHNTANGQIDASNAKRLERELDVHRTLSYRILNATGKIPEDMRRHELIPFVNVSILTLRNDTPIVLEGIFLRLSSSEDAWSYTVESTNILAKQAISLKYEDRTVRIGINQMPPKEEISISLFHTGIGWPELKSENANVKLKRKFEF